MLDLNFVLSFFLSIIIFTNIIINDRTASPNPDVLVKHSIISPDNIFNDLNILLSSLYAEYIVYANIIQSIPSTNIFKKKFLYNSIGMNTISGIAVNIFNDDLFHFIFFVIGIIIDKYKTF